MIALNTAPTDLSQDSHSVGEAHSHAQQPMPYVHEFWITMKNMLCAVLVAFSFAGCAVAVGPGEGVQKIADASLESLEKQFEVDVATRNDVAIQLGAPTTKAVAGDWEIWNYRYVKRAAVGIVFVGIPIGTTKAASFYFDTQTGILKKIDFQSFQG